MLIKKDIKKKDKIDYTPTNNIFMTTIVEEPKERDILLEKDKKRFKIESWILDNIDNRVIKNIKENTNLPLAMLEDSLNLEEWLSMVFKSIISKEDYITLGKNIQENIIEPIDELKKSEKDLKNRIKILTEEIETIEEDKRREARKNLRVTKELEQSISLEYMIEILDSRYSKIKRYLQEDVNELVDESYKFVSNFIIESRAIDRLSLIQIKNEEQKMNLYLKNTKEFFKAISSYQIPHRKEILNEFASLISENFIELEFVSPENYLYFDNTIHAIPQGSGDRIVEGINFAVINKKTKKTIIYADVIVE